MLYNYLIITFRNVLKNKIYILINIVGLGIAIACSIVAYLNWKFVHDWDADYTQNTESVYRVQSSRDFPDKTERLGMVPIALPNIVKANVKQIQYSSRYMITYCDMRIGDHVFGEPNIFVDPDFFKLIRLGLKHGSFSDIKDKGKIFISDRIAQKYFNKENVVGYPITQIILGKDGIRRPKEYIIGAVFKKPPENSSFQLELVTHFDNYWDINLDTSLTENSWRGWLHAYFISIPNLADTSTVASQLQNYIEPQNLAKKDYPLDKYYLLPLKGMMKANRNSNPRTYSDTLRQGIPNEAVILPIVMAALLTLLACFNFTNTSISIAENRLKEIGIRKVLGAQRGALIVQFMGENILLCLVALLVGLVIAELLVPAYDTLWPWLDIQLVYMDNANFLIFIVLLLIAVSVIAGLYPAFYVTSFEPVSILKGRLNYGSISWLTRLLLAGQFYISASALVMGLSFYLNEQYQKNLDMGFDRHGIVHSWVYDEKDYTAYRRSLSQHSDIISMAGTRHHVTESWYIDPIKWRGVECETDILHIGDEYFDVMDFSLLKGRKFISRSETDASESVMVNEEFVRKMGWKDDPVGKKVIWMDTVSLYVVGVFKDVYTRMMWMPVEPMLLRYSLPKDYQYLIVKTKHKKLSVVNAFMKDKWGDLFPNSIYNGTTSVEELSESTHINENLVVLCVFLGFFSLLMTAIGLYTLVSLHVAKKTKEISIRKVLGASVWNIIRLTHVEFMIIIIISCFLGGYISNWASEQLMQSIWAYYLPVSIWNDVLAIVFILLISIVTISYKTYKTTQIDPAQVLRSE